MCGSNRTFCRTRCPFNTHWLNFSIRSLHSTHRATAAIARSLRLASSKSGPSAWERKSLALTAQSSSDFSLHLAFLALAMVVTMPTKMMWDTAIPASSAWLTNIFEVSRHLRDLQSLQTSLEVILEACGFHHMTQPSSTCTRSKARILRRKPYTNTSAKPGPRWTSQRFRKISGKASKALCKPEPSA